MAEIRLRDVKPEFLKKLEAIQKDLKEKTATGALIRLVEGYQNNQAFIKQLSARNTDLHKRLTHYYNAEETMKRNVSSFLYELKDLEKRVKPLLKGLTKKAGTKGTRPGKAPTR